MAPLSSSWVNMRSAVSGRPLLIASSKVFSSSAGVSAQRVADSAASAVIIIVFFMLFSIESLQT